ncbi:MAG: hypothetical protein ACXIUO_03340 [Erythrobacter sp.]
MMELDEQMARLGRIPLPDLATLDGAALAQRAKSEARDSRAAMGLAAIAALMIGVVGGFAAQPAAGGAALMPFGPAPALTPLVHLAQR